MCNLYRFVGSYSMSVNLEGAGRPNDTEMFPGEIIIFIKTKRGTSYFMREDGRTWWCQREISNSKNFEKIG